MAGYSVISAANGAEAVELCRESRDQIAMIVCDDVMPRKNGKQVYDEIRNLQPQAKFLFTSGYNDEIIHKKGIRVEDIAFLMKPVSRQALLEKLRQMLDAQHRIGFVRDSQATPQEGRLPASYSLALLPSRSLITAKISLMWIGFAT